MLPLIRRAEAHGDRVALHAPEGTFTYAELLAASAAVAARLLDRGADGDRRPDLEEARVAFLAPPGFAWTAVQWGIWRAGGVAVPLAVSHPAREMEHVIRDADAELLIAHPRLADRARTAAVAADVPLVSSEALLAAQGGAPQGAAPLPDIAPERRAMILYTSGTTSRPKGVVSTHATVQAQVETLVDAWEWSADDHILLVLPLHHVHGIINVLTCALWTGARCTVHEGFDADAVWNAMATGELTLFMAVPTIYGRLIAAWDEAAPERRRQLAEAARRLRLMVSGSAALPVPFLERWRELTGHTLLERYGMTEIGMALSNPLHGERRAGYVGAPLPGVELRLVDEAGDVVHDGTAGEIEVRGPSVFREYWRRPDETRSAFRHGWFRTGDLAVREEGAYRILGRSSVDIIKTGGYKVSALEIEAALRAHPGVAEVAVVGVPDAEWGERVCAAVIPRPGHDVELDALRTWAGDRLAPYKLPTRLLLMDELPRNAMGKVMKPEVREAFR